MSKKCIFCENIDKYNYQNMEIHQNISKITEKTQKNEKKLRKNLKNDVFFEKT